MVKISTGEPHGTGHGNTADPGGRPLYVGLEWRVRGTVSNGDPSRVSFGTRTASPWIGNVDVMNWPLPRIVSLSTVLWFGGLGVNAYSQRGPEKKAQTNRALAALTGCVDEQQGQYVLIDDRTLNPIADLYADGFPKEGFARHLGHKVTVRGSSTQGSSRPQFKVRSVETVSENCAPQP